MCGRASRNFRWILNAAKLALLSKTTKFSVPNNVNRAKSISFLLLLFTFEVLVYLVTDNPYLRVEGKDDKGDYYRHEKQDCSRSRANVRSPPITGKPTKLE